MEFATSFRASARDQNLVEGIQTRYGQVRDILQLQFDATTSLVLVRAHWFPAAACTVDEVSI